MSHHDTPRLRLTLGYLALQTVIVGLVSLAFHAILLHVPSADVPTADLGARASRASSPPTRRR